MVSLNEWLITEQENMKIDKITYQWFLFFSYKWRGIVSAWPQGMRMGRSCSYLNIKQLYQPSLVFLWKHINISWKLTNLGQLFPINVLVIRFQVGRWWSLPYLRFYFTPEWSLIKAYMRIFKRYVYELWDSGDRSGLLASCFWNPSKLC